MRISSAKTNTFCHTRFMHPLVFLPPATLTTVNPPTLPKQCRPKAPIQQLQCKPNNEEIQTNQSNDVPFPPVDVFQGYQDFWQNLIDILVWAFQSYRIAQFVFEFILPYLYVNCYHEADVKQVDHCVQKLSDVDIAGVLPRSNLVIKILPVDFSITPQAISFAKGCTRQKVEEKVGDDELEDGYYD